MTRIGSGWRSRAPGHRRLAVALVLSGILAVFGLLIAIRGGPEMLAGGLLGGAVALAAGVAWSQYRAQADWIGPVRALTRQLVDRAEGWNEGQIGSPPNLPGQSPPALRDLARGLGLSDVSLARFVRRQAASSYASNREALTRSGLFTPSWEADGDDSSSPSFDIRDMVGRLDPESLHWTEASPALQTFLGAGLDRLRRVSILELIAPDDRTPASRTLREALDKGEALGLVYRLSTLKGERKAIELNVSTRYDAGGSVRYLRCHVTDRTDRLRARREEKKRTRELLRLNDELRAANRALAELKDRYGDLYQNAPAMYFSLDQHGRILVCNQTLIRTLGYDRTELVGRPYEDLIPEDLRPSFRSRFAQFLHEGRIEVESRWLTRDGRAIDVFVTAVAVRDPQGKLIHSRSVAQDISARKLLEAELRQNNERLARMNDELSRKNTELDEFSYVISHDLQEPIRTLIAFSGFLKQDYADRLDEQALEYLDYLSEASSRMRDLIRDLLELSRAGRTTSDFRPVDLGEVLAALRVDFAELIRSRGAEVSELGPLPVVWGDRNRIGQLLGNLIGNGLKYNESSPPRVEVGVLDGPGAGQGRRVVTLMVRDNGIGIPPQFHETIFQMFRRLHVRGRYEGTGAGLAICQKITRAHGGRIWVESQPGAGSSFFVELPLAPPESLPPRYRDEPARSAGPPPSPDDVLHVR